MKNERGNILFLILLAIILFVALTYAINSGMRGGGKSGSTESVRARAASILQFFDQVDAAVLRMTLTGGIPIENVSFEHTGKQLDGTPYTNYSNANCTNQSCRLFSPQGGGAAPLAVEDVANKNATGLSPSDTMPGYFDMQMMRWPYAKTDANDLVIRYLHIKPEVCQEIARALDIPAQSNTTGPYLSIVPVSGWDSTLRYVSDALPPLQGKNTLVSGSIISGGGNSCFILHLVYAR